MVLCWMFYPSVLFQAVWAATLLTYIFHDIHLEIIWTHSHAPVLFKATSLIGFASSPTLKDSHMFDILRLCTGKTHSLYISCDTCGITFFPKRIKFSRLQCLISQHPFCCSALWFLNKCGLSYIMQRKLDLYSCSTSPWTLRPPPN